MMRYIFGTYITKNVGSHGIQYDAYDFTHTFLLFTFYFNLRPAIEGTYNASNPTHIKDGPAKLVVALKVRQLKRCMKTVRQPLSLKRRKVDLHSSKSGSGRYMSMERRLRLDKRYTRRLEREMVSHSDRWEWMELFHRQMPDRYMHTRMLDLSYRLLLRAMILDFLLMTQGTCSRLKQDK